MQNKKEIKNLGNKKFKSSNAITLIALVITIIVMLILVAVTVTVTLDAGLFDKSRRAESETVKAIEKEQLIDILIGCYEGNGGTVNWEKLDKTIEESETFEGEKGRYVSKESRNVFTIDEFGNVVATGQKDPAEVETPVVENTPPDIEFTSFDYPVVNTNYSCNNGILTLTSTAADPNVRITLNEDECFSPEEYRYIVVRYSSSAADKMEFFVASQENGFSQELAISNNIQSGTGREVWFDLHSNDAIKNLELIKDIRFDYVNSANVTMNIDYIKFLKDSPENLEYAYFEDFAEIDNEKYTFENANVVSCQDSVLKITTTSGDPQIVINLDENEKFDPKVHKFLHIKYKISGTTSTTMEVFMSNPADANYSITQNYIVPDNTWRYTTIELVANQNVYNSTEITGFRLDPTTASGATVEIDYIGVSDRCI